MGNNIVILHLLITDAYTHSQLTKLRAQYQPDSDLVLYIKTAKEKFHLNGVDQLFWKDWPMANPANIITPELLTTPLAQSVLGP